MRPKSGAPKRQKSGAQKARKSPKTVQPKSPKRETKAQGPKTGRGAQSPRTTESPKSPATRGGSKKSAKAAPRGVTTAGRPGKTPLKPQGPERSAPKRAQAPESPSRTARTTQRPKPAPKKPARKKPAPKPEPKPTARLQKLIADAGVTSRRKAEDLIREGRVKVNGVVVTELGAKADPARDIIEVDKRRLFGGGTRVYLLLNKPKGFISALKDQFGRPVVTDLLKGVKQRVYPVGRLDYDAEGVLLLTNDGELANRLIHPSHSAPKKYLVKVKDVPAATDLARLERGVALEDGRTRPAKAHLVRETKENSWIELTVYEGRNRLVKRMCQAVGHPVAKLKRVEFAGIKLGQLRPGEYRPLTEKELERLRAF